jgi:hypothetical protein
MHYIRLLRPVSVDASNPGAPILSLKLTITTDLGDSFLYPEAPLQLVFWPEERHNGGMRTSPPPIRPVNGAALWKAGMRILKVELPWKVALMTGPVALRIDCSEAGKDGLRLSAHEIKCLLPWRSKEIGPSHGLIAPLTIELNDGRGSDIALRSFLVDLIEGDDDVAVRSLSVEEDIGESIARHIWDAGLVTTALLADACRLRENQYDISSFMPIREKEINVLELGSGVGILGIGLGMVLHAAAHVQGVKLERAAVLLTDQPEAEERATANIKRSREGTYPGQATAELVYENLDWEDGAKGKFGPLVSSRFWDYIVLSDCTYNVDSFPVLVKTLSSLHSHNLDRATLKSDDALMLSTTKVILSTKPRHVSEKALFDMLQEAGWKHRLLESIPLLNLGGEDEVVEVYSLDKGPADKTTNSKKRRGDHDAGNPAKRNSLVRP